eukprot:scaffold93098_cov26-Tisochrysis_lutea.AAC.1
MGYQPGLFGYSFLFGCTLLAVSNLERILKIAVDPTVERTVSLLGQTLCLRSHSLRPCLQLMHYFSRGAQRLPYLCSDASGQSAIRRGAEGEGAGFKSITLSHLLVYDDRFA